MEEKEVVTVGMRGRRARGSLWKRERRKWQEWEGEYKRGKTEACGGGGSGGSGEGWECLPERNTERGNVRGDMILVSL